MHQKSTSFIFAAAILALASVAQAQPAAGGDMSRYESIYDSAPSPERDMEASEVVPRAVVRGRRAENIPPGPIVPAIKYPGAKMIWMEQSPARAGMLITDVRPPGIDKLQNKPVPKRHTTEIITEDAKGNVIDRSVITR